MGKATQEEKDAMVAAYLGGASAEAAGALFGYTDKPVFSELKKRGIPSRVSGPRETFTEEKHLEIAGLYRGGLSAAVIAAQFGTSSACVYRVLELQGIERRTPTGRPASATPEQEEGMLALYQSGKSCEAAAQAFGFEGSVCERLLKRRGVSARALGKLSPQDRDEICRLYAAGEKPTSIAEKFPVTQSGVSALLRARGIERRNPSEANRKYKCNHDFFATIDTEEKAYWLGFLAADGCVSSRNNVVSLTLQKKDAAHVDAFRRAIGSEHPLKEFSNGGHPAVGVSVASPKMAADLAAYGIVPRKTFTLQWPAHLREDLKRHFLRGYVDGDGCWMVRVYRGKTEGKSLAFSAVGNTEFISEAQRYLARECGLSLTKLSRASGAKVVTMLYSGKHQTPLIAHLLYNGHTVCLGRKLEKARPYLLPETIAAPVG